MCPTKVILTRRFVMSVTAAAAFSTCLAQSTPPAAPATQASSARAPATPIANPVARKSHLPLLRTSNGISINWSGYAVSASDVTSVSSTFTVPQVGPPGSIGGFAPDFSAWVGIDGYTSATVEQTGVSGTWDDSTGRATYYAWWEMYPRVSTTIRSMTISAGDSITATVTYTGGGNFTLSIADNTNGQSFSTTASAPVGGPNAALRNSAEFVVERAATISKGYLTVLPLSTLTTDVVFSSASFRANGVTRTLQQSVDNFTEYANSANPPPAQPYWEKITMVALDSNNHIYPLDLISPVVGNSFGATFLSNGTAFPIPGVIRQ